MKTPIPSSQKTINLLLLAGMFSTCLSACKKDKPQPPEPVKSIMGDWYTSLKTGEQRTHIYFFSDSTVATRKLPYADGETTDTVYSGRFRTQGDSLKISITEKTINQQGAVLSKEPSNIKIFQQATYKITGPNLVLNYTDTDGAAARITFLRLLPLM
ncbi:hypothetical protein [Mucilaginibacter celer]|nr:hypothetical protein [Mucilaginibacter celer]